MKQISILWAKRLENKDTNYSFFDVPTQLKDEVMEKLTQDGYTVNENGEAVIM